MDGVKIIVDGQERSITDKEGYYKLDQVKYMLYLGKFYVFHSFCYSSKENMLHLLVGDNFVNCCCFHGYQGVSFVNCCYLLAFYSPFYSSVFL